MKTTLLKAAALITLATLLATPANAIVDSDNLGNWWGDSLIIKEEGCGGGTGSGGRGGCLETPHPARNAAKNISK